MDVVLAWILGIALGAVLFTALVTMGTVLALRRWNRVDPRTPGIAPLVWLCSPSRCARLHRRLRIAVANARMRQSEDRAVRARGRRRKAQQDTLVAGLVAYACTLDRQLVTARHAPFVFRVEQLARLGTEVCQVEHLAARLSGAQLGPLPSPPPLPLLHIAERLDAVDAARRELDALAPASRIP